jgi:acetylornithine/succinyldiaminopimelate/putrescine aminotransferase
MRVSSNVTDQGDHRLMSHLNPDRRFLLEHILLDKPIVRAEGHYLYDAEGNAYLDFLAQYGAVPFGHNPNHLWDAVRTVWVNREPSLVQPLISPAAEALAALLSQVSPSGPGYVTFTNSGAETVEAAIKLARAKTQRPTILSTHQGFHGKTLGALSATGNNTYRKPFLLNTAHFDHIPYADLDALDRRLSTGDVAGFIVEPIQGEAGMITPPRGYLSGAAELCRKAKTLFILDEVQTGLGRTGKLFAAEHEGVEVDILLLAKALGGGLVSLGACVAAENVWDSDFGLYHSSTFANNHLSCSIGLATVNLLLENDQLLVRQVAENGDYLRLGLERLVQSYPKAFAEVSGRGLMQGLRLAEWNGEHSYFLSYVSSTDTAVPLVCGYLMAEHYILTAPAFNQSNVLRIEPSLTINRSEIARLLLALDEVAQCITAGDIAKLLYYITEPVPRKVAAPTRIRSSTLRTVSYGHKEPLRAVSR